MADIWPEPHETQNVFLCISPTPVWECFQVRHRTLQPLPPVDNTLERTPNLGTRNRYSQFTGMKDVSQICEMHFSPKDSKFCWHAS